MADIKSIAEKLVGLSSFEVLALSQILAQEYGIRPMECLKEELPKDVSKIFEMKNVASVDLAEIEKALKQKQKRKMYIPRTIGKPCKKKFSRRK